MGGDEITDDGALDTGAPFRHALSSDARFSGAKIAILRGSDVLTLLRDDDPQIAYPNQWDLPGGGREGHETPFETVARELHEELNLTIDPARLVYHRREAAGADPAARVHFFVARWDDLDDASIRLGDEGQGWAWMAVADFLRRTDAVAALRGRLSRACDALGF